MKPIRQSVGGLGNIMFKQARLLAETWDGLIPDEYVQSERYWKHHKEKIKRIFGEGIGYTDMVSLQIRRGDYLHSNNFYTDPWEEGYYKKAIEYFPNERFLVFCYDRQDPTQDKSDREWCKENLDKLIPGRWEFHEPLSETEDLNKMASCKGNIMANGTFSWWAAYLNPNPNKIVTCPKLWFTDGIQRCDLQDEWIKI